MPPLSTRLLSGWTVPAVLGTGVEFIGTGYTFYSSRKQGDSVPITLAKTALDIGINATLQGGLANIGFIAATIGYDVMMQSAKENAELQKQMKYTGSGRMGSGYFNMSGAGYTMRQRAINQLRANGQNINSVLGNEARNYLKSAREWT